MGDQGTMLKDHTDRIAFLKRGEPSSADTLPRLLDDGLIFHNRDQDL